jgi:hypothetical protein
MNPEIFLSGVIQKVQGVEMTPVLMLVSVFSFLLLLVLYHWSGLAEKVENLTVGKKTAVFFSIALLVAFFYYVFYKAGKFNELLNNSAFNNIVGKISDFIYRWSRQ